MPTSSLLALQDIVSTLAHNAVVPKKLREGAAKTLDLLLLPQPSESAAIYTLSVAVMTFLTELFVSIGEKRPSSELSPCLLRAGPGREAKPGVGQKEVVGLHILPHAEFNYLEQIRVWSNKVRHDDPPAPTADDAETQLRGFLHVLRWFYCEYERGPRAPDFFPSSGGDAFWVRGFQPFNTPSAFVDRGDDLQILCDWLADHPIRWINLAGRSGIGKSALLYKLCDRIDGDDTANPRLTLRDSPGLPVAQRGVYLDCRALKNQEQSVWIGLLQEIVSALRETNAASETERTPRTAEMLTAEMLTAEMLTAEMLTAETLTAQMQHWLTRLSGGRFLIWLDNLESLLDIEHGMIADTAFAAWVHLVLTRGDHGLRVISCSRLPILAETLTQMLQSNLGKDIAPIDHGLYRQRRLRNLPDTFAIALLRQRDQAQDGLLEKRSDDELRVVIDDLHGSPYLLSKAGANASQWATLPPDRWQSAAWLRGFQKDAAEAVYQTLTSAQQRMAQILSVFARPMTLDQLEPIWKSLGEKSDAHLTLRDLVDRQFALDEQQQSVYQMHPRDQEYVYAQMSETGRSGRRALHRLAAEFYAAQLAGYAEKGRAQTSLMRFYRFEQPDWQAVIIEFLRHSTQVKDRKKMHLLLAHIFFDAFWWWGEYVDFPLCRIILERWQSAQAHPRDQAFALLLQQFFRVYPRKRHWQTLDGDPRWNETRDVMGKIRRHFGFDDPLAARAEEDTDDARHAVKAITALYLAESCWLAPPPRRDFAEARRFFHEAVRLFKSHDNYSWSRSFALFGLAEMRLAQNAPRRALKTCDCARQAVESPDHEAPAQIARIQGDSFWRQGEFASAWDAYARALSEACRMQVEPNPSDFYTRSMHREILERVLARLRQRPSDAPQFARFLHEFWPTPVQMSAVLARVERDPGFSDWMRECVPTSEGREERATLTARLIGQLTSRKTALQEWLDTLRESNDDMETRLKKPGDWQALAASLCPVPPPGESDDHPEQPQNDYAARAALLAVAQSEKERMAS